MEYWSQQNPFANLRARKQKQKQKKLSRKQWRQSPTDGSAETCFCTRNKVIQDSEYSCELLQIIISK